MSVDQSGGLSIEIGVLYLSHAMLVLAELIEVPKPHVINELTHTLEGEVLA